MSNNLIGGLCGLGGVVLGWLLSWLDRQGKTQICNPELWFESEGAIQIITCDEVGKSTGEERKPGKITAMVFSFNIISFAVETKFLHQCRIDISGEPRVMNANQMCILCTNESRAINSFNQIVLPSASEQKIEVNCKCKLNTNIIKKHYQ